MLLELALIFLRLGTLAFGGPAAHIAIMRSEFVERRHWLTDGEFLDLVGVSNLIPGPGSTEVAILIGMRRAGWRGLLLSGLCFILPAALIVCAIASAYVRFGHLPRAAAIFYGIKPVIIVLIMQAVIALGRSAIKTRQLAILGCLALVLCFLGLPPLVLLFATGAAWGLRGWLSEREKRTPTPVLILLGGVALLAGFPLLLTALTTSGAQDVGLSPLFVEFLKLGSIVYGSGYVLLAFLRTDLVARLHWLTSAQLLDAVSVGQFTPGPVFTTATFIGYLLAGPWGAVAATVGVFLPAFIFVAVSGRFLPRVRSSATAAAFLDGANVAAVALMVFVAWELGRAALVDTATVCIAAASALLMLRWRVQPVWLMAAGAVIGLLLIH